MNLRRSRNSSSFARLGLPAMLAIVGAGGLAVALPGAPASGLAASANVVVNVSGAAEGTLPSGYIGFSYESDPTVNSGKLDDVGNLPGLLRNFGTGTLRFGGNSVDRTYAGASPSALAGLARLLKATNWHVIYSVNLGHFDASGVTRDVRAVAATLGSGLTAIACGNEPDNFVGTHLRPAGYTEATYLTKDARACIDAVRTGDPKARISGPNTFHTSWLPAYAAAEKGTISTLAEQYYALNNCAGGHLTAATLLSRATAAAEAGAISTSAAAARTAQVPLLIAETNSANCGGIRGVSNAYASALWAADYVLTAAEHGSAGMGFHGYLTGDCDGYTPLCLVSSHTYTPEPVYYGLLFAHLLGTGSLLHVTTQASGDIVAHAVRGSGGTVRVLIENLTAAATTVTVRAGTVSGAASVLRMTGPSLNATSGVRIQGAAVRPDGSFVPGAATALACHSGTCQVPVAAYSAVIVTLPR